MLARVYYKSYNSNLHELFMKELTPAHRKERANQHSRQHTPTSETFLVAEQPTFIFKSRVDLKEKQFFPHKMSKNNYGFPVQLGI